MGPEWRRGAGLSYTFLIAHLSPGRICFPTHKRDRGPLLVFYFLRPRYRAAITEIRQHLFASRPRKRIRRRGKMVEGEGKRPRDPRGTHASSGGVQSCGPIAATSFFQLARRETKVFSREIREGGGWARVRYRRSKSRLNPIDGIDRAFLGWSRYPSQEARR